MKIYEYMVVYSFQNGVGRSRIRTEKPIKTYTDVERLDTVIKESNGMPKAFVTDFKLLRIYKE